MEINRYIERKREIFKEKKRQQSKNRLRSVLVKKMQTSFIGALSAVEDIFPELVDTDRFVKLRQRILDNGNRQIRDMDLELINYNVDIIGVVYESEK